MAKTSSIDDRIQLAGEHWEQCVEAESRDEGFDLDAAVTTCVILGRPLESIKAEAAKRRAWRERTARFQEIMDPARIDAAREEIHAAQAEVDDVQKQIAAFDPAMKAAKERLARANAGLARVSAERSKATTDYADVRLGKTKEQLRDDAERRLAEPTNVGAA